MPASSSSLRPSSHSYGGIGSTDDHNNGPNGLNGSDGLHEQPVSVDISSIGDSISINGFNGFNGLGSAMGRKGAREGMSWVDRMDAR